MVVKFVIFRINCGWLLRLCCVLWCLMLLICIWLCCCCLIVRWCGLISCRVGICVVMWFIGVGRLCLILLVCCC